LCTNFGPGEHHPPKEAIKKDERRTTISLWQERWSETQNLRNLGRQKVDRKNRVQGASLIPHNAGTEKSRYICHMCRFDSLGCCHCQGDSDTEDHTLFKSGHLEELGACFGHRPSAPYLPDIQCGPEFEGLSTDPEEKSVVHSNAEEVFRLVYKIV